MSAGSQHYVLRLEARHFRKAQSGLSGHEDKRVIPAAEPGLPSGRREQRVYFGACQETHNGAGEAFTRNCEYALDLRGMRRGFKSRVTKEGVNRSEPQVAAPNAQPLILLQVIEKLHN